MWLNYFKNSEETVSAMACALCRILSTGRLLSVYRGTHRVGNLAVSPRKFFSISCVAIAVENLTRRRRRKNCDASTYQSNNFGVSRNFVNASSRRRRGLVRTIHIKLMAWTKAITQSQDLNLICIALTVWSFKSKLSSYEHLTELLLAKLCNGSRNWIWC